MVAPRAKYLNTPRTTAFCKGELLYTPTSPAGAVATLVVCEGPLDALAVESWAAMSGRATTLRTLAPSGTALTSQHVAAIGRMRPNGVILWPDGDAAGQVAGEAWRAQLAAAGVKSGLLRMPTGQDPLSWLSAGYSLDFEQLGCATSRSRHPRQDHLVWEYDAPVG